tara:strand:- start:269 stop:853 length:585 start_codon:yes stop_codon:yes gene_type:complete
MKKIFLNTESNLIELLFPLHKLNNYVKYCLVLILGSLLLTVSAKIQVPFWPVPMTMQTFVVFLIGMSCGSKLAFLILLTYLLEGAFGLPVFAKGGGVLYLSGPTAGYLYGMAIAALILGYFADKGFGKSILKCFFAITIATLIIFGFGVGYLGYIIGYEKAIIVGLTPFIPSELFKIVLAVLIIPKIWNFTRNF